METVSAVVPFVFEDQLVRVIQVAGEPWFVARDVCAALSLVGNASQHTRRLPESEVNTMILNHGIRGNPETVIVSEPGLYRLIFRSDKPEAKRFQDFVFKEVLPTLRKTGSYTVAGREVAPATDPAHPLDAETIAKRIDMVREARQTFGRGAARQVWLSSGLPVVEAMLRLPAASAVAPLTVADCLAVELDGNTLADLWRADDGDGMARHRIRRMSAPRAGLWIDNASEPFLKSFGRGWALRVVGAEPLVAKFQSASRRGLWLPEALIVEALTGEI